MNKNYKLILFSSIAAIFILVILFSSYIVPFDPYEQNLQNVLAFPSKEHILGTDKFGRDIFSRILIGGQTTLFSAFFVIAISVLVGTLVGIIAGYIGGSIDNLLMRISDIFLAFPDIVLAIAVASILGGGIMNSIIALALISWPKFARLARAEVLVIKNMPFIDVAKMSNTKNIKILFKHILPNIYSTILTVAIIDIGAVIMSIAGLSFIGLGAAAPEAEWGAMMSGAVVFIQTSPWVILSPILAIFITVSIFNMLGEAINEYKENRQ